MHCYTPVDHQNGFERKASPHARPVTLLLNKARQDPVCAYVQCNALICSILIVGVRCSGRIAAMIISYFSQSQLFNVLVCLICSVVCDVFVYVVVMRIY